MDEDARMGESRIQTIVCAKLDVPAIEFHANVTWHVRVAKRYYIYCVDVIGACLGAPNSVLGYPLIEILVGGTHEGPGRTPARVWMAEYVSGTHDVVLIPVPTVGVIIREETVRFVVRIHQAKYVA